MPRIDLITGFLGSGKTTFIKKYARYLIDSGLNIGILENDYGPVNVDMMLLQELPSERCELEMVAGGCDYDCHRRRFKTKLIAMGMAGYDVVIVEPSGIYDVDEFFDVLAEEPLDRWYHIGNVIAIVDAALDRNLSEESEYLLASQIVNAGKIVLSRTQEAGEESIRRTMAHLSAVMDRYHTLREMAFTQREILAKDWNKFTDQDFAAIAGAGYVQGDHIKEMVDRENAYSSLFYMHVNLSERELRERVQALFSEEGRFGRVIRVKGFVKRGGRGDADAPAGFPGDADTADTPADSLGDVQGAPWVVLNATRESLHLDSSPAGQDVIIVIGEGLKKEAVDGLFPEATRT